MVISLADFFVFVPKIIDKFPWHENVHLSPGLPKPVAIGIVGMWGGGMTEGASSWNESDRFFEDF